MRSIYRVYRDGICLPEWGSGVKVSLLFGGENLLPHQIMLMQNCYFLKLSPSSKFV